MLTSDRNHPAQIFIAVSYRAACKSTHESGYREILESVVGSLEERGLRVYLAPREEEWGARRPDRHVGIKRDLRAIREAGVFVLFLDGNDSDGALVEFGMAVSLGKFILVIARQGEAVRGYLRGMLDLGLAELFYLSNDEIGNFVVRIEKAMRMALEGA